MQDRFKFNAVVSSYYDIDTPEEYKEVEPQFYLKNVDVFCTGEIGIDYDTLLETVKEQAKDLTEKEIGQIMQHFEDNSNSPDCEFVSITPDKIIQSTGLKDKNGKLIYEGDIIVIPNQCPFYDYKNKEDMKQDLNSTEGEIKGESILNYIGIVEWIYSRWQYVYHCVNPKKQGISGGINQEIDFGFDFD